MNKQRPKNKARPEDTGNFSIFQPRRFFFIQPVLLIGGKVSGGNYSRDVFFRSDAPVQKQGTA